MPDRVVECGIAEQDMVSQAGAMALGGLKPIVHSFACFLTSRANEQIFNNATEGRKVVYSGSLAGLVPGMPGHSHQMVRDIALMSNMPGLIVVEPCCEAALHALIDQFIAGHSESIYLRLVSVPFERAFPEAKLGPVGVGTSLRDGRDAAIVAYGPIMLNEAWEAAEMLARDDQHVAVIDMPWLNRFEPTWLRGLDAWSLIVVLDNHMRTGGLGDNLAGALAGQRPRWNGQLLRLGVEGVPVCGSNNEVLRHHGLDAQSVAARVREASGVSAST